MSKSVEYKEIPISVAKEISEKYDKSQVIIATFDKMHLMTHITTYGQSISDSEEAAQGGNFIKSALGWPDKLCNAKPEPKNYTEKELIDALKNMQGMFDTPLCRLKLGSSFTQMHNEVCDIVKDLLKKIED
jgi:hypothetical protein